MKLEEKLKLHGVDHIPILLLLKEHILDILWINDPKYSDENGILDMSKLPSEMQNLVFSNNVNEILSWLKTEYQQEKYIYFDRKCDKKLVENKCMIELSYATDINKLSEDEKMYNKLVEIEKLITSKLYSEALWQIELWFIAVKEVSEKNFAFTYYLKWICFFNTNQYKESFDNFELCLNYKADTNFLYEVYMYLWKISCRLGKQDDLEKFFSYALVHTYEGDWLARLEIWKEIMKIWKEEDAILFFLVALKELTDIKLIQATYHGLSFCYMKTWAYEKAIQNIQLILELDIEKDLCDYYYQLWKCYVGINNFEVAKKYYHLAQAYTTDENKWIEIKAWLLSCNIKSKIHWVLKIFKSKK